MKLQVVLLLSLLPVALAGTMHLERMLSMLGMPIYRDLHQREKAKAALGVMGVCEPAAECMLLMQAEYNEHRTPAMRRRLEAAGPGLYALVIDETCSTMKNVSDSCFTHCTPDEDSVYGVINSANHIICNERRDGAVDCAKDYNLFARPFTQPFIDQCGDFDDTLDEHVDAIIGLYRNSTELKYLGDEIFGERGFIADWCRLGSCYLDELESLSEEKCGDRKHGKLVRDLLHVLVPKAVAMLDRLYVGCLLPKRCKRAP